MIGYCEGARLTESTWKIAPESVESPATTSGTPVKMSPVILNAANVKLEFVSNAVSPRWLHHAGSETWRTTGVAQTAEKLANATIKEDNVVNILKGDVCVKQIEGYGVTVLTFRTLPSPLLMLLHFNLRRFVSEMKLFNVAIYVGIGQTKPRYHSDILR